MSGNLVIGSPGYRLNRKLTMRFKFFFNLILNTRNRSRNGYNLVNDMISKNVDKRVNITTFRRSNKITNFSIFNSIMTHIEINFIY